MFVETKILLLIYFLYQEIYFEYAIRFIINLNKDI